MTTFPEFHPSWLRSFLEVAHSGSFSDAARKLGVQQSTVSQHVQKLETALGKRLLVRTTHSVALTTEGAAARELATQVMDAHDSLGSLFFSRSPRQRMRLGISEDFALLELAEVLRNFRLQFPDVDLELTVGLSQALYDGFNAGKLDVIFAKRCQGDSRGAVAWREKLAWIGKDGLQLVAAEPVPLIAYAPPAVTRTLAINALQQAGLRWHLVCTSGSLSGIRAAALAGMGVAAHSPRLLPIGLSVIKDNGHLPALGQIEFVVLGPGRGQTMANKLVDALLAHIEQRKARDLMANNAHLTGHL